MTIKELNSFFKEHLVPKKLYKVGGKHNKRVCLEKNGNGFDIFFCDNKKKIGLIHVKTEFEACKVMKEEMRKLMLSLYGISWNMNR
ncbi:MAG: hypothetical protein IKQ28_08600 [Lachnospiraceae bacterium]|nr:hypothetical protein [Lachnospiraceae bacterium]MBR6302860.1 hypothetical protein [Lachnospiraceae bacterium]MBR6908993.1 hypothetical protein [Lachnospiraceae bacterium]